MLYNNILVDVGVPYAKLKPYVDVIEFVLLTHIHKDHFNKTSLIKLAIAKPSICFYVCEWLEEPLMKLGIRHLVVLKFNEPYQLAKNILVSPFMLYHDVDNCGWRIMIDKFKIFHATDTVTLDGIEARGYNCYALEYNHCEEEYKKIIEEKRLLNEFCYELGAMNSHLSFQQAARFIKENATKEHIVLKLHISSRYKGEEI